MKTSRFALTLSLAALLGGALALPGAASAHERDGQQRDCYEQRDKQHHHHDRYADNRWYLQCHREAQRHERRELKRLQRRERRQLRRELRHHHGHRHVHTVVTPRPHHNHRYPQPHDRYSPLRLQIGYELEL